ncbi:hypothetical protein BK127_38350 [Paenibacillus sp. FSL H7-0331]|nr:hypothetical protein BK127_38350 [Paenibacillus sp. FSL H7-0331]
MYKMQDLSVRLQLLSPSHIADISEVALGVRNRPAIAPGKPQCPFLWVMSACGGKFGIGGFFNIVRDDNLKLRGPAASAEVPIGSGGLYELQ